VHSPDYISDFLTTTDGPALTKAFMLTKDPTLRRRIVNLVQEISATDDRRIPLTNPLSWRAEHVVVHVSRVAELLGTPIPKTIEGNLRARRCS
jgi:hypothetical protein